MRETRLIPTASFRHLASKHGRSEPLAPKSQQVGGSKQEMSCCGHSCTGCMRDQLTHGVVDGLSRRLDVPAALDPNHQPADPSADRCNATGTSHHAVRLHSGIWVVRPIDHPEAASALQQAHQRARRSSTESKCSAAQCG